MIIAVMVKGSVMMIELHIKEHCKTCPNFEVEQRTHYKVDMTGKAEAEHHLMCKNEELCKKIAEHLQMCDTGKKYAEGFADGFKATHEKSKRIKAIFKGGV